MGFLTQNLPLSQKSRSGKSSQVNFTLDGTYSPDDVVKKLTFNQIAAIPGDGAIVINASIIRAKDSVNGAFPDLQLHLFEEDVFNNLNEGTEFRAASGFTPQLDLSFLILDFDLNDIKKGANWDTGKPMETAFALNLTPTAFRCEDKMTKIYGILVCREAADYTFVTAEKWNVQLSVTY